MDNENRQPAPQVQTQNCEQILGELAEKVETEYPELLEDAMVHIEALRDLLSEEQPAEDTEISDEANAMDELMNS